MTLSITLLELSSHACACILLTSTCNGQAKLATALLYLISPQKLSEIRAGIVATIVPVGFGILPEFYPYTSHSSPDSVHTVLLPGITQVEMDLAITIKSTRVNIQNPVRQTNRPAI